MLYSRDFRARQPSGRRTLLQQAIAAIRRNNGALFYVPQNFSGAWTDSAGTDPVNEIADVVGLMTDQSYGANKFGPELVTNGDFSSAVGWGISNDAGGLVTITGGVATLQNTSGTARLAQTVAFQVGKWYEVNFVQTSGSIGVYTGGSESLGTTNAGAVRRVFQATANSNQLGFRNFAAGTSATVDNVSVREVLGAVATQSTTANKPMVGLSNTNLLPNSTMQGASAGIPGSPPSGWQYSSAPGVTRSIVGVGIVEVAPYIDVRFAGTATGATDLIFDALGAQVLPALSGQRYALSAKFALIAGAWPTKSVNFAIFERSSTGSSLGISSVDIRASVTGNSLVRVSVSRTLSQATTAFVSVGLRHSAAIGDTVDFTFRMTMPQLEPDLTTSKFVPTSSGAVTQKASAPYMMFEGADSLNVALTSTGSPFVRSYTSTGSVDGFTSATTTGFVLGQPTVSGRDVCAIVCGPTAITGADLAIIDRLAASIGAEL